jgi:acyl carrier protein
VDDALAEHPAIARAVTFPVPHPTLGEDVAAALVLRPGATVTDTEIRRFVGSRLAPFKAPRRIVIVDAIPLGATGKPERQRLAATLGLTTPVEPTAGWEAGPPALTAIEAQVAKIWSEVLGRAVGPEDDFIELGGDSLRATVATARITAALGVALPLDEFFDRPTVAAVAARLARRLDPAVVDGEP